MSKHTPGPWYVDRACNIWRRDPSDLYQNGGSVAGDRPIATVNKGWYGSGETGFPVEANARLIAAAPDLLEACQTFAEWLRREEEGLPGGIVRGTPEGERQWRIWWEENLRICNLAQQQVRAAIAKATGEQP